MPETPRSETTATPPTVEPAQLETNVVAALRTIYDPEIPVNIYDLGLIYQLDIDAKGRVDVWEPAWSPERLSEDAKLKLGLL